MRHRGPAEPSRWRGTAGFTLVELLVAISVLALLSVAVARGLHVGTDGFRRAHRTAATADRMRDGRRLLTQLVAAGAPVFAQGDSNDRRVAFAGEEDTLAFVTRLPQSLGVPQMVAARIFIDQADGQAALTLAWHLDLPGAQADGVLPEQRRVIEPGIEAIVFAYFGPPEGGGAPVWQNRWEDRAALPLLVRMTLPMNDGRPDGVQELVVAPPATGTTACIYDSTDVECRRTQ